MQNKDAEELLNKYRAGKATEEEINWLLSWVLNFETERQTDFTGDDLQAVKEEMWLHLLAKGKNPHQIKLWPRIAAAASILLFLSIGSYFLFHKHLTQQIAQNQHQDIAPGSNRATLTLSNGQKIILSKGLSGKLAQQGNALVQVNSGNAISYTVFADKSNLDTKIQYNTLSTASGEQSPYPLVLADGTKIWLNAESSITFPTSFTGKERIVKVTGEAYFEVVHNAAQPFKVIAKGETIQDIGTHFNINAYNDEPSINTTLLEGSVKVSTGFQNVTLVPGQQSLLLTKNNKISIKGADIEDVTAWKDGYFAYKKADINTVMRQFARWYNVDVTYEGAIPATMITGKVHRNVSASQALKILAYLDIHYRISGKKIIITT
ncbi:FecR family protein [Mucilaginibacter frigoritolerans]|uniref:FecR family protein n=1 Tax=Mucilaginibacter frigoritolerans TaxID=652788 RepID=A0A562UGE0_9SPHI|nr:FecR family protein [Mucilaginibacter frigoritolerans]TWJ04689.1 FecR family protein [Mucilaginibacter frigoritolerans]